jgi:hypothetical protein
MVESSSSALAKLGYSVGGIDYRRVVLGRLRYHARLGSSHIWISLREMMPFLMLAILRNICFRVCQFTLSVSKIRSLEPLSTW